MGRYSIGVDFGTLSGRAVLVDVESGRELASSVLNYPHGVMDQTLPTGERLGQDWALQHPQDYLDVLKTAIPEVLRRSGVSAEEVIGIGVDVTACTMLPVKADGTPLCFLEEYCRQPHAWVKLWKHHAAQDKANALNRIARETGQPWLSRYGGKVSSEWAIPKIWQMAEEAPQLYEAADRLIEAVDWIVWQLCGKETRSCGAAGYKALWDQKTGYPSAEFFGMLNPRLAGVVKEKLAGPMAPLGQKVGELTEEAAALTGLKAGTAVAAGNVDAHVCVPAAGIDGPGKLLAIMGTSTCHILMGDKEQQVPGMCGVVEDGVLPGYFGYEAGQTCVGDHFAWFIGNCLPAAYYEQARAEGKDIYAFLGEKAGRLEPGESGLIALDWWNGNRSVLVDADLTGLILGMTLQTKPEELYRALIEATAYGTRVIVENFRESGVPVEEFYAAGGISQKDPVCMQIYADVLNMPVRIAGSDQSAALGSAIFGAVAGGGYPNVFEAARAMGKVKDTVYAPRPQRVAVYDRLYREYLLLHDYFGRGANDVMKRLKAIKKKTAGQRNERPACRE